MQLQSKHMRNWCPASLWVLWDAVVQIRRLFR